jgi:hypothetical protein
VETLVRRPNGRWRDRSTLGDEGPGWEMKDLVEMLEAFEASQKRAA